METIRQRVEVAFSYPVHFTSGVFSPQNAALAQAVAASEPTEPAKVLCVVDAGVLRSRAGMLDQIDRYWEWHAARAICWSVVVPGGEGVKNDPAHVAALHATVDDLGICRHSYVVAVGGGAVIDMAGYAAATAHRGIRLIRIPTTVLAQNDSGVGVKNSVNRFGKKNFLGTFAPPWAVINDFDFLTTVSDRDWTSGTAEAVKVALLKDPRFFAALEADAPALRGRSMDAMKRLVHRCAALHLDHIATSGDPFELGSSRPLDFGHWAAHKLEQLSDYVLRHGEAVSIGIALDSTYAHLAGLLARRDWERILGLLAALGLPLYARELEARGADGRPAVLGGLDEFRQHLGGALTVPLVRRIGDSFEVHAIDERLVVESIEAMQGLAGAGMVANAAPVRLGA